MAFKYHCIIEFLYEVLDDSIINKEDNFKFNYFFEIEDAAIISYTSISNYVQIMKLLCFLYDCHKLQEMSEDH